MTKLTARLEALSAEAETIEAKGKAPALGVPHFVGSRCNRGATIWEGPVAACCSLLTDGVLRRGEALSQGQAAARCP